jgi:hypothetical protein
MKLKFIKVLMLAIYLSESVLNLMAQDENELPPPSELILTQLPINNLLPAGLPSFVAQFLDPSHLSPVTPSSVSEGQESTEEPRDNMNCRGSVNNPDSIPTHLLFRSFLTTENSRIPIVLPLINQNLVELIKINKIFLHSIIDFLNPDLDFQRYFQPVIKRGIKIPFLVISRTSLPQNESYLAYYLTYLQRLIPELRRVYILESHHANNSIDFEAVTLSELEGQNVFNNGTQTITLPPIRIIRLITPENQQEHWNQILIQLLMKTYGPLRPIDPENITYTED